MPSISKPTGMSSIWATSGIKTPPAESKIAQGWVVELPPYQTANYIENKQDQFNAHTNMYGVPGWDGETEYQGGTSYTRGSNGKIYKCLVTHVNADPTNPLNAGTWVEAFEPFGSVAVVQNQLTAHIANYGTLAGLVSAAAARNNLSVFSKAESDIRFAAINGSQSQVFSVALATQPHHAVRLDQISTLVPAATESVAGVAKIASTIQANAGTDDTTIITPLKGAQTYLRRSLNLGDLTNVATARANLGLGSIAVEVATSFLRTANNLSDVANVATARANLGITSTATQPETYFLRSSLNLSDVANVVAARANLGLGSAATRDVGTVAGTVAAGDDTRIVNAVQNTRTVNAGNGMTGGGALSNNVTLTLGTPSSINATSTNAATGSSHTHALDLNSFFGNRLMGITGHYELPGGLCIQWGRQTGIPGDGARAVAFPRPFVEAFQIIAGKSSFTPVDGDGNACGAYLASNTTFVVFNDSQNYANSVNWIAIGRV